ncbi:MAG: bifunctional hydroxymethylpyrimidine kinase/phosphomethylpyrimidine kinase [Robiginitomaculum sp.]|nr:bifunctional hydroxymethylpyrimidine kinase/phosphomethylpyrimidine kinase [Robiginitomaculum sp.]
MSKPLQPVVLTIAGSDSGGGAGVQADIKTITVLGSYAASAITAITAQNTCGVQQVQFLDASLVRAQIKSVLDDFAVDIIKIGMLGNADIVSAVAEELRDQQIPIVLDPVMIAKGGSKLLSENAINILLKDLLPQVYLLTPNAPEAEALTGVSIEGADDQLLAAKILRSKGAQAVLIKGGHIAGDTIYDLLLSKQGETVFESPRINTKHTHGTGCTLSSAIAVYLAQDLQLGEAVRMAREYMLQAIIHAPKLGNGHGPLAHNWPFRINK